MMNTNRYNYAFIGVILEVHALLVLCFYVYTAVAESLEPAQSSISIPSSVRLLAGSNEPENSSLITVPSMQTFSGSNEPEHSSIIAMPSMQSSPFMSQSPNVGAFVDINENTSLFPANAKPIVNCSSAIHHRPLSDVASQFLPVHLASRHLADINAMDSSGSNTDNLTVPLLVDIGMEEPHPLLQSLLTSEQVLPDIFDLVPHQLASPSFHPPLSLSSPFVNFQAQAIQSVCDFSFPEQSLNGSSLDGSLTSALQSGIAVTVDPNSLIRASRVDGVDALVGPVAINQVFVPVYTSMDTGPVIQLFPLNSLSMDVVSTLPGVVQAVSH